MPARPLVVAFDVLQTLFTLDPLLDRLGEVGQPRHLLQPWFLRTQRDGLALSLSGEFRPFSQVARQALRTESGHTATEADIEHVLAGFAELPAHPDADAALQRLAKVGVRVGCLTVGGTETTARFLDRAGLARYVERIVTVEDAGVWKPAPGLYHTAAGMFGMTPERMAVVAVHAWDCHGAKRAGCLAGWCNRLEGGYGDVFTSPDVRGDDLVQVVDGLLSLPVE